MAAEIAAANAFLLGIKNLFAFKFDFDMSSPYADSLFLDINIAGILTQFVKNVFRISSLLLLMPWLVMLTTGLKKLPIGMIQE